jgi:hypothetical protein
MFISVSKYTPNYVTSFSAAKGLEFLLLFESLNTSEKLILYYKKLVNESSISKYIYLRLANVADQEPWRLVEQFNDLKRYLSFVKELFRKLLFQSYEFELELRRSYMIMLEICFICSNFVFVISILQRKITSYLCLRFNHLMMVEIECLDTLFYSYDKLQIYSNNTVQEYLLVYIYYPTKFSILSILLKYHLEQNFIMILYESINFDYDINLHNYYPTNNLSILFVLFTAKSTKNISNYFFTNKPVKLNKIADLFFLFMLIDYEQRKEAYVFNDKHCVLASTKLEENYHLTNFVNAKKFIASKRYRSLKFQFFQQHDYNDNDIVCSIVVKRNAPSRNLLQTINVIYFVYDNRPIRLVNSFDNSPLDGMKQVNGLNWLHAINNSNIRELSKVLSNNLFNLIDVSNINIYLLVHSSNINDCELDREGFEKYVILLSNSIFKSLSLKIVYNCSINLQNNKPIKPPDEIFLIALFLIVTQCRDFLHQLTEYSYPKVLDLKKVNYRSTI